MCLGARWRARAHSSSHGKVSALRLTRSGIRQRRGCRKPGSTARIARRNQTALRCDRMSRRRQHRHPADTWRPPGALSRATRLGDSNEDPAIGCVWFPGCKAASPCPAISPQQIPVVSSGALEWYLACLGVLMGPGWSVGRSTTSARAGRSRSSCWDRRSKAAGIPQPNASCATCSESARNDPRRPCAWWRERAGLVVGP